MLKYAGYFLVCIVFFLSSCGAKKKTVLKSAESSKVIGDKSNTNSKSRNVKKKYADLLVVSDRSLNEKLYYVIDDWMGTNHRMGGMTKSGVDCSGFVNIVYEEVYKKNLPRSSREMAENIKVKNKGKLKEGDLVFFSFSGKGIDHVGIYLHNDKFVHVSTRSGVVISNLNDIWYAKYFVRSGTPNF